MSVAGYVLAIDQGTTSTRALVFDRDGRPVGVGQRELRQFYPADGWVEHDAEDLWNDTVSACRLALAGAKIHAREVAAVGIANQRETTLLWDRRTGLAVHHAIVWQDRRTAAACRKLSADGLEPMIRARTGLLPDPYFSATKLAWLLDNVPGARAQAERGELAFGTVESFLLYRLTGGRTHVTDVTNAARTMLFDIHKQDWDDELLALFRIPREVLPEVTGNSEDFGVCESAILGAGVPITGIAGDQQSASIGQACLSAGMTKSTYGTGAFILMNTGETPVDSGHRLLSTIAYRIDGRTSYALEGSIFVAGAAIQWLRDGLRVIPDAASSEYHAQSAPDTGGVYLVPAFTGLGAPYWDPDARGALIGLTRDTGISHVVRAALESTAYQTRDLMDAMAADGGATMDTLRVDGGMVVNNWLCQFLADMLNVAVERPAVTETTALGAAYLAGLRVGVFDGMEALAGAWRCERRFEPAMSADRREALYAGWKAAATRVRSA
jgi:glycerol kinase